MGYISDLLWTRTTTKDHRIPRLHELLAPRRTDTRSSAEKAFDAVELMFERFGGGEKA